MATTQLSPTATPGRTRTFLPKAETVFTIDPIRRMSLVELSAMRLVELSAMRVTEQ